MRADIPGFTRLVVHVGTASGYLLGRFCPNDGVSCAEPHPGPQTAGYRCQGHMLWLIITLLTCMSPFGILVFQVSAASDSSALQTCLVEA